ncbi:MAG: hypothetical protein ABI634_06250, partial [Acidobacteriota bacterium]
AVTTGVGRQASLGLWRAKASARVIHATLVVRASRKSKAAHVPGLKPISKTAVELTRIERSAWRAADGIAARGRPHPRRRQNAAHGLKTASSSRRCRGTLSPVAKAPKAKAGPPLKLDLSFEDALERILKAKPARRTTKRPVKRKAARRKA